MTALMVYGIKNCNTVKSAITWLRENEIEFEFHDYKSKGIEEHKLKEWCKQVGWEVLVNKRGTTWRQLDKKIQDNVTNEKTAITLMMAKTSVIKRPLLEKGKKVSAIGFDEADYLKVFKKNNL
ncbi:MAG: ArsC family reductase [Bacteroidia bacterium]|nr:ArsC family reductase [Bacteroidia bacterium]